MRRRTIEFEGVDGRPIKMEVKLTLAGNLLLAICHFTAYVLRWLPPIENFKAAMNRHTLFRLNGGPWLRYEKVMNENH